MNTYESFLNTKVHIDQRALLDQTFQSALKKFEKDKRKFSSKCPPQNHNLSNNFNSALSQRYTSKGLTSFSNQNNYTNTISSKYSSSNFTSDLDSSPLSLNSNEQPGCFLSSRYSSSDFKQPQHNSENENNVNQMFGFHFESQEKEQIYTPVNRNFDENNDFQMKYSAREKKVFNQPNKKEITTLLNQPIPPQEKGSIYNSVNRNLDENDDFQMKYSARDKKAINQFNKKEITTPLNQPIPPQEKGSIYNSVNRNLDENDDFQMKYSAREKKVFNQPNKKEITTLLNQPIPPQEKGSIYNSVNRNLDENDDFQMKYSARDKKAINQSNNKEVIDLTNQLITPQEKELIYSPVNINLDENDDFQIKYTAREKTAINQSNNKEAVDLLNQQISSHEEIVFDQPIKKDIEIPQSDFLVDFRKPSSSIDLIEIQTATINNENIPIKSDTLPESTQESAEKNKEEEIRKFREHLKKRILLKKERESKGQQDNSNNDNQNIQDKKMIVPKQIGSDEQKPIVSNKIIDNSKMQSSTNNISSQLNIKAPSISEFSPSSNKMDLQSSPQELSSERIANSILSPQNLSTSPKIALNDSNNIQDEIQRYQLSNISSQNSEFTTPDIASLTKNISQQSNLPASTAKINTSAKSSKFANNLSMNENEPVSSYSIQKNRISKNNTQPSLIEQSPSFTNSIKENNLNSIMPIHSLEDIKTQDNPMFKKKNDFLAQIEDDVKKEKDVVSGALAASRPTDLINAFKQRMMNFTSNSINQKQPMHESNYKDRSIETNKSAPITNGVVQNKDDDNDLFLIENDELNLLDNGDFNFQLPNHCNFADSFNENEYNISDGNNDDNFDSSCFVQLNNEVPDINMDDFENVESSLNSFKKVNKSGNTNNLNNDDLLIYD
ncbi:hypothetical protein M9Y10_027418 [Tritrichomonas musculus]|uniref:Uncharacterized protein n=1 Tax=Tritrichomonas musculus TaxID=1915356 RepID=A0ABR2H5W0_9EUKA